MDKISLWGIKKGYHRQLFKWRTEVSSNKELNELVRKNNRRADCFCTIYQYKELVNNKTFRKPLIDKIFFDLDGYPIDKKSLQNEYKDDKEGYKKEIQRLNDINKDVAYNEMHLLHKYFESKRILHMVLFSGHGFHVYVFCKEKYYNNHINLIANYQITVENSIYNKLSEKQQKEFSGIDAKIIGDFSRHGRKENTWNPKRQRYCIPLTHDMIHLKYKEISDIAKQPNYEYELLGNKILNLNNFDVDYKIKRKSNNQKLQDAEQFELNEFVNLDFINIDELNEEIQALKYMLPACLMFVFDKEPAHEIRWQFVRFMYDLSYSREEVYKLCILLNWIDFDETETLKQINNIYNTASKNLSEMYSCDKIKIFGYCIEGCKGFNDIEFTLSLLNK